MMNNDTQVNFLCEQIQSRRLTVNRLVSQLDAVDEHALGTIRDAFAAQLAAEWSDFSTKYRRRPDTFEMLQRQVDLLAGLVDRFGDIVQQPRLSGIAQGLNHWLQQWDAGSIEWRAYLRFAADDQLEEIETQLSRLKQLSSIGDDAVEELVRQWLKYQAERLRDMVKEPRHVVDWLDRVGQTLADARQLVDDLLAPALEAESSKGEHDLVARIRRRWGEQQHMRVAATSAEVENLGLDEALTEWEEEWRTIRHALPNLSAVLATCSKTEATIARDQIDAWQFIQLSEIEKLLKAIADVRTVEEWSRENSAFLGTDSIDETIMTPRVQTLIDARPETPTPDGYSSYGEYSESMNLYRDKAQQWLTQCDGLFQGMLAEIDRWQSLKWPEVVLQDLPQIENDQNLPSSLEQLAIMSDQLRNTDKRASDFAEQSLGNAERAVWQELQRLRQAGRQRVNLPEQAAAESKGEIAEAVAALANRNLIKVTIEL